MNTLHNRTISVEADTHIPIRRVLMTADTRRLSLTARVYGVRYPAEVLAELSRAGIDFGGWLPNCKTPEVFASFYATVHIPRRPYARSLPGIPTIKVFEALACGIPLVCAPWDDIEGLFTLGMDYLVARNAAEMSRCLIDLLYDDGMAREMAFHGWRTILSRHTCAHRVDELMDICRELSIAGSSERRLAAVNRDRAPARSMA